MARVPMVTRTMTVTKAKVLCLNIAEGHPFEKEIELPRTYKDEKKLMEKIKSLIDNDNEKAVHIVSTEIIKKLYGMSEDTFMANAEILPDRTAAKEN